MSPELVSSIVSPELPCPRNSPELPGVPGTAAAQSFLPSPTSLLICSVKRVFCFSSLCMSSVI